MTSELAKTLAKQRDGQSLGYYGVPMISELTETLAHHITKFVSPLKAVQQIYYPTYYGIVGGAIQLLIFHRGRLHARIAVQYPLVHLITPYDPTKTIRLTLDPHNPNDLTNLEQLITDQVLKIL